MSEHAEIKQITCTNYQMEARDIQHKSEQILKGNYITFIVIKF